MTELMRKWPPLELPEDDLVLGRVEVGHDTLGTSGAPDREPVLTGDDVEVGGWSLLAGFLEGLGRPLCDEGRSRQVVHGIRFISEGPTETESRVRSDRVARTRAGTLAAYRVLKTDKGDETAGGFHRHIAALCLEGGRRVPKATAISNIETRLESYYTSAGGQQANVEVVERCARCASKYLRTDRDSTIKDNLLELPDC